MIESSDALGTDPPVEIGQTSDANGERHTHGDLASISDELTDAMQAATYYVEAVRRIAKDNPPILDRRNRDILIMAMAQIMRANRAIKDLHGNLIEGSEG